MFLSIVWHLHQPIYRDPVNGEYVLPWVNLHATRNYHPMARLALESGYPCTFNIVPCLLEQLEEYAAGAARDPFQEALEKDPSALSIRDVRLLRKIVPDERDPAKIQRRALLSLFSPLDAANGDREELLALQKKLQAGLIPLFRRLKDENRAEIITSPYYHPLLPLVFDSSCPWGEKVPSRRFRHPEDGEAQLVKARDYFRRIFGSFPDGLWPSEGGVSREVARSVSQAGFRFALTDENVLWRSLKSPYDRKALYKPYSSGGLALYFRDRELSDLLSFEYHKHPARDAVDDFLARLEDRRKTSPEDSLCLVVLDGENPWEFYPGNGVPFLREFYSRILAARGIEPVFLSEHLKTHAPDCELDLVPGTWMGNFSKWVGDPAKNAAWDELGETRKRCGPNEEIYIAEGSDWFWWYGEPDREEFDVLFKSYLRQAERKAGKGSGT
ncbi:MAG: hypothetical protein ACYDH0_08820 [Candidatus Aminicenantales bacterium]